MQGVVSTESTFDCGFNQPRRESIPQTSVEQLCLAEFGFRVVVGEDLFFELLQELLDRGGLGVSSAIGVNFAILSDFGGSKLALPIRYADELVK